MLKKDLTIQRKETDLSIFNINRSVDPKMLNRSEQIENKLDGQTTNAPTPFTTHC